MSNDNYYVVVKIALQVKEHKNIDVEKERLEREER